MKRIKKLHITFIDDTTWDSVNYREWRHSISIEDIIRSMEEFERTVKKEIDLLKLEILNEHEKILIKEKVFE